MAADKAKLLHSLKIDRGESEPPQTARRRWPALLVAAALACAAVVAAAIWLPEFRISQSASQQAAPSAPAAAPAAPAAAAAAEPRRAGSLAASGYVVARRKATIAAEITGKVTEVLIEEGMVVQAGQVVARLDSVLAEKDLALAQSRAASAEAAIAMITATSRTRSASSGG